MRFRKKPVEVEAVQFTGENGDEIVAWCSKNNKTVIPVEYFGRTCILIHTIEGEMNASPGDWIIRGIKGEFYPCKPDIFEMTYEPVTCKLCEGTGKTITEGLPYGNGKEIDCPMCEGSGVIGTYPNGKCEEPEDVECPTCKKQKTYFCTECGKVVETLYFQAMPGLHTGLVCLDCLNSKRKDNNMEPFEPSCIGTGKVKKEE